MWWSLATRLSGPGWRAWPYDSGASCRPSGSGVDGIFEKYASATAVAERAAEGRNGKGGIPSTSSLHELSPASATCADVFRKAAAGDVYAQEIVNDTAKYLAIGCINCCRCFDPEVILFTGGMANAGEQLLEKVREQFAIYHWNINPVTLEFRVADAPEHACLIGAAYAARRALCG